MQKHIHSSEDTIAYEALENVLEQGLKHIPEDGMMHYMAAIIAAGDSARFLARQVNTALELVGEEDRMYGSLMLMRAI